MSQIKVKINYDEEANVLKCTADYEDKGDTGKSTIIFTLFKDNYPLTLISNPKENVSGREISYRLEEGETGSFEVSVNYTYDNYTKLTTGRSEKIVIGAN